LFCLAGLVALLTVVYFRGGVLLLIAALGFAPVLVQGLGLAFILAFGAYTTVRPLKSGEQPVPPLTEIFVGEKALLPQPNLLRFAEAVNYNFGYFNVFPDADGLIRQSNLVIRYKDDFYPSLDVQVLRRYLDVPDEEFALLYNPAGVEQVQFGPLRVPTDPAGRILINYQGAAETFAQISFSDVAAGKFPPGTFTGKMVLVGTTATGIADTRGVPLQEAGFPGVEIHANVLDTMLTQRFIRRGDREQMIDLSFILFFGMGIGFVLARVRPSWSTPLSVAVLAVFLVATYFALVHFHVWLNIVVPGGVLVLNVGAVTGYRVFVEEREKRKTRAAFAQYVPPGLMREMLKNPDRLKLGG
ncbi:MAG: CHASE2 domain-containing protein, partial [Chloroflexota bacterium]